jgi:mannose-6-phosphate isomerase-like protein (cupin superfamily)
MGNPVQGIKIVEIREGGPIFEDDEVAAVGFTGGVIDRSAGTTFLIVGDGTAYLNGYPVRAGMYGCSPGKTWVQSPRCLAMIVTAKRYTGMFAVGGPVEDVGRLRYIDGCTDTGLIHPIRLGDPCLNYLHFPPGIRQTEHHHPSHRIGLIFKGGGLCHTQAGYLPMRPGNAFVLPVGEKHHFETTDESMHIIAFHPDSECGPTDESHQMLNATKIGAKE